MTTETLNPVIGFIGAGNMAYCLISGLMSNAYPPSTLWASNPSPEKLGLLQSQFNIHTTTDNAAVVEKSDILVLAVKPQMMKSVITDLQAPLKKRRPLMISIASGVTVKSLLQYLDDEAAIVRCMPNVAAFVGSGATGMFANPQVTPLQRDLAESIMRSVGITLWVNDEKLIEAIAALSGSGPAYFFLMIEALETAAVSLGLNAEDAHLLTLQTALGAARLGLSTNETCAALRARVTSKGGITEQALAVLENRKAAEAFKEALHAAYKRSLELAKI